MDRNTSVICPSCFESVTIFIDPSELPTRYIEDCQVCCNPMLISISLDENDEPYAEAGHPDETI